MENHVTGRSSFRPASRVAGQSIRCQRNTGGPSSMLQQLLTTELFFVSRCHCPPSETLLYRSSASTRPRGPDRQSVLTFVFGYIVYRVLSRGRCAAWRTRRISWPMEI